MNKIILIVFVIAFCLGLVSAWEWDNNLDYKDNDMTFRQLLKYVVHFRCAAGHPEVSL